ncbi:MAG: signal peptidase I [Bacilli bacterium]|nr:signal peptidase I [Bacilli bacterium]
MKKVLFSFIVVFLVFCFVFYLCSFYHVSLFGCSIFQVRSGSMAPTLDIHQFILVQRQDEYYEGDIITYQVDDYYVTHRIVQIQDHDIITRGDANNKNDEPFSKEQVVGKVIYRFVVMDFVNYLLVQPFTWVLLVGAILLWLGFSSHQKNEKE